MSISVNEGGTARGVIDTLVIPLDGSKDSSHAVPVAARLAKAIGADLELLSAVDDVGDLTERNQALDEQTVEGVNVARTVTVDTDPVAAICDAARQPGRQLCMATQGRGRSAAVMGSVALGVLRALEQPILCVGPRLGLRATEASSIGVLVCLDGSGHSEAALDPAMQWAALLRQPLTLTAVVEDAPTTASGSSSNRWFGVDDVEGYLSAQAQKVGDRVDTVETLVLTDPLSPAGAVRSLMSREAVTMVVAGTRGRSGVARALLGSVAAEIVQHSAAPVLVVPA
jgi:nucleotide-binding universal stress UspA family protein